jgi:hypothetical protein
MVSLAQPEELRGRFLGQQLTRWGNPISNRGDVSPTGITSETGAMACEGRRLATIATSSPWAVADEVKEGDEWVPYVGG